MRPSRSRESSVEEDLARLLLDRPPVPITPQRESKAPKRPSYLPRDGSLVVSRRCRIVYRPDTGWYLLTLIPERAGQLVVPRWVLPSKSMEQIEREIARTPRPVFRISGETTIYDGRAFILLRKVSIARSRRSRPPKRAATEPKPPSEAGTAAPKREPKDEPSTPDAIIKQLRRDLPGRPILLPTKGQKIHRAPSVAPTRGAEQLEEDRGEMRIDRLVTVRGDPAGEWMEVRFEADNTLQDQPLRLLPCKLLAEAERIVAEEKRETIRLRISGVITEYKHHRYLLLRKVLREREMGQF